MLLSEKPHISIWRHNYNFIPLDYIYTCGTKEYLVIGRGKTPREAYINWNRLLLVLRG